MPAVFREPDRSPRSCPPPCVAGRNRARAARVPTSAPTPAGPQILCPLRREQVDAGVGHGQRQAANHLGGVAMEQSSSGAGPLSHFAHWVQDPGLAVGGHDRHSQHISVHEGVQLVQVDEAPRGHPDHVYFGPPLGEQPSGWLAHRGVLHRRHHEPSPLCGRALGQADQRQVVGLGGASAETPPPQGARRPKRPPAHERRLLPRPAAVRSGGRTRRCRPRPATLAASPRLHADRAGPIRCSRGTPRSCHLPKSLSGAVPLSPTLVPPAPEIVAFRSDTSLGTAGTALGHRPVQKQLSE